jgi:hypothetical protein
MKKIIKPAEPEEAVYFSDFSGRPLDIFPSATLSLNFSYGSKYDGSILNFHLNDEDAEKLLAFLKENLNADTKQSLKQQSIHLDDVLEDNIQSRDWTSCDYICHERDLLEQLI